MSSERAALAVATAVLCAPALVHATQFLDLPAAQRAVFPEARRFEPVALQPQPAQLAEWLAQAGRQPPRGRITIWRALGDTGPLGWFFTDEILGRQEFIDYALGINMDGTLRTPEVMAYREGHGGEVRNRAWRRQFAQRKAASELRTGVDIQCIAGATLSCEHLTAGIRYLQAIWRTLAIAPPDTP
jgi:hypothetical protein